MISVISCSRAPLLVKDGLQKPKMSAILYVANESKEPSAAAEAQKIMFEQLNKKFYKLIPLDKSSQFVKGIGEGNVKQPEDLTEEQYKELGVDAVFFGKVERYEVDSGEITTMFIKMNWVLFDVDERERVWEDQYEAVDTFEGEPTPPTVAGETIYKNTCEKCISKIIETLP